MRRHLSGQPQNLPEKEDGKGFPYRALLLFSLLLFLLWGFYKDKLTLRVASNDLGMQTAVKEALVHPEVLNLQESFSRVSELVKPAVVSIATIHLQEYQLNPYEFYFMDPDRLFEQFFNMPSDPRSRKRPRPRHHQRKIPGTGSGVLIDPEGYILTNEHVVRGADEITVTLSDDSGKTYEGKVIGRDERTDLAIIKISSSKKFPFAKLGNSKSLRVGDWAIAIGSPFGLGQTVTVGVISASRQNLTIEGRTYKNLIQTDAAINPGNSGGPLLNIHGEVIGINTAIFSPSGAFAGIGFAIPIDSAKEIIPQLREKGKVVRGWIGVILESEIDDAKASVFGIPDGEGSMVKDVLPDFPASQAGLRRGDVIREFDGKEIKDNSDLQSIVAGTPPGKKVPVKIIRNRKTLTVALTTAEAPSSLESLRRGAPSESPAERKQEERKAVWLGATFGEGHHALRRRYGITDSEDGVVVMDVEAGSKAEEIGLRPGDLVRAVNQEPVPDVKTFEEVSGKTRTRKGVVFDILRRGAPLYLSYMGPEK